jgi:hypothetical protein
LPVASLPNEELQPKAGEFAELKARRRDLMGLCARLDALAQATRGRWYRPAGIVLGGAALGELLSGFWMLSSKTDLDGWVVPAFFASVVVLAVISGLLLHASKSVMEQRADSVGRVHEELKALLEAFEEPASAGGSGDGSPRLVREVIREFEQKQPGSTGDAPEPPAAPADAPASESAE